MAISPLGIVALRKQYIYNDLDLFLHLQVRQSMIQGLNEASTVNISVNLVH